MAHVEPLHQDLRCLQIQLFSSLVVKELNCFYIDVRDRQKSAQCFIKNCCKAQVCDKLEPKIPYNPYKVFAQTAKAVIRLHRCAVWSQPLLFAYEIKKKHSFCLVL